MKIKTLTYKIIEIPDPFYSQYHMEADGNVLSAVSRDCEHLLRNIANLPPGTASLIVRLQFVPSPDNQNLQSRLVIYIIAQAHENDTIECMRLLLEHGSLNRFYNFRRMESIDIPIVSLKSVCEVVRREDRLKPLHPPEFNYKIPPYYYTISPFDPKADKTILT